MKKLAIVTTHPIQYNAPWFQLLSERNKYDLKVFYTWSQSKKAVKDRTFGKDIVWDIPLLENYNYEFVENISKKPGSHHFFGINCPTLIPKIKEYHPDAILFFGWNFKSHLLAMIYFKGKIPVWFRGDSTLLNETGGFRTKLRRLVLKTVYSQIDKAFYVGQANKEYFLKHNMKANELIYAPHAIDNDRFKDDEEKQYELKAKEWRKELGFEDDSIVLLYAGKFEPVKQVHVLIESLLSANSHRKQPVKLLLVGNGPLEDHLKKIVGENRHIQFLGFQNQTQMPIVYRLGDICCLISKSETWGLAVNEAMACSRPVIVTDKVGAAEDMLVEGYNGYSFDHSNKHELTSIIENLKWKELYEMRQNAKDKVGNFTMLQIVKALENNIP